MLLTFKLKDMQITRIQLFALMQNQVMEIRNNMSLARNVVGIRNSFKKFVGLPKNASHKIVLQEIGRVYKENNLADEFNNCMNKFDMVADHGIKLV
jgi:hypothetical protein